MEVADAIREQETLVWLPSYLKCVVIRVVRRLRKKEEVNILRIEGVP